MDERLKQHALGFWEIVNKPKKEELQQYYADKYYQEAKGSYELEYTEEERLYFRAKLEQRMSILHRYLPHSCRGKFLDVGCGEGYALAFFREQDWSVTGIDFSAAGVRSKNPGCQDALVTGDIFSLLETKISDGETYDVVWLQNVLEHVIDPLHLLASLLKLVSSAGIAVVTVPNDCSITQHAALEKQHIDKAFWVAPPDHLNYFTSASLSSASNATGWECLEIVADFPIDWFVFHPRSNYVRDKSVGKAAHKARVQIENLLHQQPIDDVMEFWSAAAKLGIGRNITAFLRRGKSR